MRPKSEAGVAEQARPEITLETKLRVTVGSESWTVKLKWFGDLLTDQELSALRSAFASDRALALPQLPNRAAMTVAPAASDADSGR